MLKTGITTFGAATKYFGSLLPVQPLGFALIDFFSGYTNVIVRTITDRLFVFARNECKLVVKEARTLFTDSVRNLIASHNYGFRVNS